MCRPPPAQLYTSGHHHHRGRGVAADWPGACWQAGAWPIRGYAPPTVRIPALVFGRKWRLLFVGRIDYWPWETVAVWCAVTGGGWVVCGERGGGLSVTVAWHPRGPVPYSYTLPCTGLCVHAPKCQAAMSTHSLPVAATAASPHPPCLSRSISLCHSVAGLRAGHWSQPQAQRLLCWPLVSDAGQISSPLLCMSTRDNRDKTS